jgi:hypothetical protein
MITLTLLPHLIPLSHLIPHSHTSPSLPTLPSATDESGTNIGTETGTYQCERNSPALSKIVKFAIFLSYRVADPEPHYF